jgi:hypothetical protein
MYLAKKKKKKKKKTKERRRQHLAYAMNNHRVDLYQQITLVIAMRDSTTVTHMNWHMKLGMDSSESTFQVWNQLLKAS